MSLFRKEEGEAEQSVDADEKHALEPRGLAIAGDGVDDEGRAGNRKQLKRAVRSFEDLVTGLSRIYDEQRDVLERDVAAFLLDLMAKGLLVT